MAQKVNIILVDDLDGSDADETVTFGLDGNQYEIDLTSDHAKDLRLALAPYTDVARKTQARRGRKPAALKAAEEAAASATKNSAPKKRSSPRKRAASMEQIEASKS